MEVDFPCSREEFRDSTAYSTDDERSRDALSANISTFIAMEEDLHGDEMAGRGPICDDKSARSGYTSESDGFLGWPSGGTSTASTEKKEDVNSHRSSMESQQSKLHVTQQETAPPVESNHDLHNSASGSDQKTAETTGSVTVEFPADRTPFRRTTIDSHQSLGSNLSGYKSGGSKSRDTLNSDNDSSTANSSIKRRPSISSGCISLQSTGTNNTNHSGSFRRRPSTKSVEHRSSLATIKSEKSYRASVVRQSLRKSFAKQGSGKSLRSSSLSRQGSEKALRKSLERMANEEKMVLTKTGSPPRRKSHDEPMEARPRSLTQQHDDNSNALPILGWDRDISDGTDSSFRSSLNKGAHDGFFPALKNSLQESVAASMRSLSQSVHSYSSSLKASQIDSYGPAGGVYEDFRERGGRGMTSSLEPNSNDGAGRCGVMMMEEEYDPRKPWRKAPPAATMMPGASQGGEPQGGGGLRLNNGTTTASGAAGSGVDGGGRGYHRFARRASGITSRSSFTSELSFGELMMAEFQQKNLSQQQQQHTDAQEAEATATMDDDMAKKKPRGMTREQALAKMGRANGSITPSEEVENVENESALPDSVTTTQNRRSSEDAVITALNHCETGDTICTSKSGQESQSVNSSLGDDDDGSELTELRRAQETLFPVLETSEKGADSVLSSEISFEARSSGFEPRSSDRSLSFEAILAAHNFASMSSSRNKDLSSSNLSSLDIVQEERKSQLYEDEDVDNGPDTLNTVDENESDGEHHEEQNQQPHQQLDLSDLDDLPSSGSIMNDPFKKNPRRFSKNVAGLDDDSVSYSDIDVETGMMMLHSNGNSTHHQPPSIKMCMTVRDSTIEREFATEQLTDVDFGETKLVSQHPNDDDESPTLQMLLEGPSTVNDNSFHPILDPIDDSRRSGDRTIGSKRSGSKKSSKMLGGNMNMKKKIMGQTSKLDTATTKRLRRKNKRLWKFCVWNCRKITLCLVLGLAILLGIAVLAWWSATKVTNNKNSNTENIDNVGDGGGVEDPLVDGEGEPSSAPTGLEGSSEQEWPPSVMESGRIPPSSPLDPADPIQYPSISPSLSSSRIENVNESSPSSPNNSNKPSAALSSINVPPTTTTLDPIISSSPVPSKQEEVPSTSPMLVNLDIPSIVSYSSSGPTASQGPSANPSSYDNNNVYTTNTPTLNSYTEVEPSFTPSNNDEPFISSSPSVNSSKAPDNMSYPSLSPSSSDNNATSVNTQPSPLVANYSSSPSSSPSISNATISGNITSNVEATPSSGGLFINSGSNSSIVAPSSYPSSSPSSLGTYASYIEPLLANSSLPSSPSSNASIIDASLVNSSAMLSSSSNASFIEPPSANSSLASSPSVNSSVASPLSNVSNTENQLTNSSITDNNDSFESSLIPTNNGEIFYKSIQAINGGSEFEYAGASVSMSPTGEFIAVGFKQANNGLVERTGLVRVYQRTSSDNMYYPLGVDSMFGKATGDEFGASVSISNDGHLVAVGARSSSSSSSSLEKNGDVTIFEYSDASNSWVQVGSSIEGLEGKDRLGFSLALSGDGPNFRVAVGAPQGNGGTGSASVHEYNGIDWVLFGDVVTSDNVGDRAGFSVSLSNNGNVLAVGAFASSCGDLPTCGRVSVYKLEASSLVNQGQIVQGSAGGAQFGYSLSLSGDGQRLVVGSNGFNAANLTKTGLCEIYELQDQNWTPIAALMGREENEEAGSHVSMSKNGNVVSCTKNAFVDGAVIGAVVVLEDNGSKWNIVDTVTSSHGNSTSFGASVSLSQDGDIILAGAPSHNSSAGFFELLTKKFTR